MGSEWEIVTLDSVCIKITDGSHQSPRSVDFGKPMASVKDLRSYGLDLTTARHISSSDFSDLVKQGCQPEIGDILIAKDGNSALDKVCTFENKEEVVLLSSVAILRPNKNLIIPRFLKYYFCSSRTLDYLKKNFISGAAIPRVILKDFKRAEIYLPPLPEQKAIAHTLGALDDKIELNRQMNETLEAMAQALFKSWFVDFDPVIDNALAAGNPIPDVFAERAKQRQALTKQGKIGGGANKKQNNPVIQEAFPNAFEYTEEMGWIPDGWGVGILKDLGGVICGKTPPKKEASNYGNDVPFIKVPDTHGKLYIIETKENLSKKGDKSQIKKRIPPESVCVSCIATVGQVFITSKESHTNQQINSIVFDDVTYSQFIYFTMRNKKKELIDLASGGSTTLNLNTSNFSKIKFLSPKIKVVNCFHKNTKPMFRKILDNQQQDISLTKLRDTLLPKLLSGELRIPDAERLIEESEANVSAQVNVKVDIK